MATILPGLSKTWQIVGNVISGGGTSHSTGRAHLYNSKQAMVSVPLAPWTVVGSSNGVAFGLDAVDRWTSVSAPIKDSWIVLKQTGISANFQLLIKNTETVPVFNRVGSDMYISQSAGFTGGGATTRPTATDEVLITLQTTNLHFVDGQTANIITNVAVSTDGQCTRIWAFRNEAGTSRNIEWVLLDKLQDPIAELTNPWIATANHRLSSDATSYNDLGATNAYQGRQNSTNLAFEMATSGRRNGSTSHLGNESTVNRGVNQLSGDYFMAPVAPICITTSNQGIHGQIADLWWAPDSANNGDTYPEAGFVGEGGLDQFVQVGDLIVPWNGTVPQMGVGSSTRRQGRLLVTQGLRVEEEEVVEEPIPPATTFVDRLVDDGVDHGIDFDCLDNFPQSFVLARGRRNLANSIARQLQTPEGFLALAFGGDPDYGYDLRGQLNSTQTLEGIAGIEARVKEKVERDERVQSANVVATYDLPSATLTVEIAVEDAEGPFTLILNVSEVSTAVVLQPAG